MPKLISIHAYTADFGTQLQLPEGGADFWPHVASVHVDAQLNEAATCRLAFKEFAPTPASTTVDGKLYLHAGRIIMLTFESGAEKAFRIRTLPRNSVRLEGESVGSSVTGVSLWMDLGGAFPRKRLAASGFVDVTKVIGGRTAAQALAELGTLELPSLFQVGTVAAALASKAVRLVLDGKVSFLDLLYELAAQVGGDVEFTFSSSPTPSITIDIVEVVGGTGLASTRPISYDNVTSVTRTSDGAAYYSHLLALAGDGAGTLTVQEAVWPVTGAHFDGSETALTLAGDPVYHDTALIGLYFGSSTDGYFEVTAGLAPGEIVVAGDASAMAKGTFALDATGKRLTALPAPSVYAGWYREQQGDFDVQPYANLIESAGHSANMSLWSGGLPQGAQPVGTPAVEQISTEDQVKNGTASAKITADKGEGIAFPVTIEHEGAKKVFSAWAHVSSESGAAELTLVDSDGVVWPSAQGQEAKQDTERLEAISIKGMTPSEGVALVRVTATDDGQVFYVDALTLTRSNEAYAYSEDMGPRALWRRAGEQLVQSGGALPDVVAVTARDLSELGQAGTAPLVLGSRCRLTLEYNPSTKQHQLQVDTRIVALSERYEQDTAPYIKAIEFSRRREDLSDRLSALPKAKPGNFERGGKLLPRKPDIAPKPSQREDDQDPSIRYGVLRLYPDKVGASQISEVVARFAEGAAVKEGDAWTETIAEQEDDQGRVYYEGTVLLDKEHTSELQMRVGLKSPFDEDVDWPVFRYPFDYDKTPQPRLQVRELPRVDGNWDVFFYVEQDEDSAAYQWELIVDGQTASQGGAQEWSNPIEKHDATPSGGLESGTDFTARVRGYPAWIDAAASGEPGPWVELALTASEISGASLKDGSLDWSKLIDGQEIVQIVDALPDPNGYEGPRVVFLTSDFKLYRYTGSGWTALVPATDISGTLADAQIAALAASKITGQLTDEQLEAIAAAKLTGEIEETQISDEAITTPKLAAAVVTAAKIATAAIIAEKIAAGAITAEKIIAGAITTAKLATGAVTTLTLAAQAVTAAKIATNAVTADKVEAGAITADKILAGAVTAAKLAVGAVTADKIDVAELSAIAASLGTITGGSLNIGSGAFTVSTAGILQAAGATIDGVINGLTVTESGGIVTIEHVSHTGLVRLFANGGVDINGGQTGATIDGKTPLFPDDGLGTVIREHQWRENNGVLEVSTRTLTYSGGQLVAVGNWSSYLPPQSI
ncbi:MAG: hypothetical protein RhofKO_25950 [Rhodothermales bacterium]